MFNKAKEKRWVYSRFQGGEAGVKLMINAVKVESNHTDIDDTDIDESKWLSNMDHIQLIANTYQQTIVFLLLD
jgi:hypothetical protein